MQYNTLRELEKQDMPLKSEPKVKRLKAVNFQNV